VTGAGVVTVTAWLRTVAERRGPRGTEVAVECGRAANPDVARQVLRGRHVDPSGRGRRDAHELVDHVVGCRNVEPGRATEPEVACGRQRELAGQVQLGVGAGRRDAAVTSHREYERVVE
jgi:hypothetical protein